MRDIAIDGVKGEREWRAQNERIDGTQRDRERDECVVELYIFAAVREQETDGSIREE